MRALFDWSYDLLSDDEQRVFRALSVFAGGCTLQNAAAVCGEDELVTLERLTSLVEKSLLQAEHDNGGTRYRLLESMRHYARERLVERGEEAVVARAHAAAYLALAEALGESYESTPDRAWFSQAQPDLENWRSALAWTLDARGDLMLGQHLAAALRSIWNFFAPAEGRSWVRKAAQTVDAATDEAVIAKLDLAEAALDASLYQYKAAYGAAEHALALCRRLGDVRGEMEAQRRAGQALIFLERIAEGETQLRAALATAEALGLRKTAVGALITLATARRFAGDAAEARARLAEALAAARATGFDRQAALVALDFAELEFEGGDVNAALRLVSKALDEYRGQRNASPLANGLSNMAAYLVALERYPEARSAARDALTLGRDVQGEVQVAFTVQHLAAISGLRPADHAVRARDDRLRAARLLGYADARFAALGAVREHTEQQEYHKLLAALRDAFGDDALAKLMAEGSAWTEDHAAAEALLV
jgi:non-specific serine/threonine protein kinase